MPEPKPASKDRLLGQLAVEQGYLTSKQLGEITENQRKLQEEMGIELDLPQLLLSKKLLTNDQLQDLRNTVAIQTGEARLVAGYEVISKIGQGGMGAVYKARKLDTGDFVALKILLPSLATPHYVKRFERESRVVQKLHHENIVGYVEFGRDPKRGLHFCALEFVDGEDIAKRVKRLGVLSEDESISITHQMARALEHAYFNGLVHRDIKPENIMVTPEGRALLLDLGLARPAKAEATRLTQSGLFMGSPYYASPEQARAEEDLDFRSDIYSLGATLYFMITGRPPFEGEKTLSVLQAHVHEKLQWPAETNPEISEGLCLVVAKMMAKDPADRYQEPCDLIRALDGLKEGRRPEVSEEVRKASTVAPVGVAVRRRRRPASRGTRRSSRAKAAGRERDTRATRIEHAARASPKGLSTLGTASLLGGVAAVLIVALTLAFARGGKEKERRPPPPVSRRSEGRHDAGARPTSAPRRQDSPAAVRAGEGIRIVSHDEPTAASAFSEAEAYERAHPDDTAGVIAKYEAVARDFSGTPVAGEAKVNVIRLKATLAPGAPAAPGRGLIGEYFSDRDFDPAKLALRRVDPQIDFDWGGAGPAPGVQSDDFSVRWTGRVEAEHGEPYTFYTVTDDGARLWVDGQKLVDEWKDQGTTERSGTISLEAGATYDIVMEYYEAGGGAVARLMWSSASTLKQVIPRSRLLPRPTRPVARTGLPAGAAGPGAGALPFGDHRYELYTQHRTWHDAKRLCEERGGHLVTISSSEENEFVRTLARNANTSAWIGLTDEGHEGEWRWVTGEKVPFTEWAGGEPNNAGEAENWAQMWGNKGYAWNDAKVHDRCGFVCEWEPAAVAKEARSAPERRTGAADLARGLVGHWKFDEQAAPFRDSSPSGLDAQSARHDHGHIMEEWKPVSKPGLLKGCLEFGPEDVLRVPQEGVLDPRTLTVCAWVRPGGLEKAGAVASRRGAWQDGYYGLRVDGSERSAEAMMKIGGKTYAARSARGSLKPGTWSHVAMTYDGAVLRVFLNGEVGGSKYVGASRPSATPGDVAIGRDTTAHPANLNPYSGGIDDVRIYDRALSAGEVKALHSAAAEYAVRHRDEVAEIARRVGRERALRDVGSVLDVFFDRVKRGDYGGARRSAESAAAERTGEARRILDAAARVARALESRRRAVERSTAELVGRSVTLETNSGPKKGVVERSTVEGVELSVQIRRGARVLGTSRLTVPWRELTPAQEEKLSRNWKPEGADGHVALALAAALRGDGPGAEKALAAAGEHPLAQYVRRKVGTMPVGRKAPAKVERAQEKEKPAPKAKERARPRKPANYARFVALGTFGPHGAAANAVLFTPDGSRLISGAENETIFIWDLPSGERVAEVPPPVWLPEGRARGGVFSHHRWRDRAEVTDAKTGKNVFWKHGVRWLCAVLGQDGKFLYGGFRRNVYAWDLRSGSEARIYSGHTDEVTRVATSRDDRVLASASRDRTVRIWNVETGTEIAKLAREFENADRLSIAVSPDGSRIVTYRERDPNERKLEMWEARTGRPAAVMTGHGDEVRSVGFSPDGRYIVTASKDKTACVWDALARGPVRGRRLAQLKGHQAGVNHAEFSPDGRWILTASDDKTAVIWQLRTARPVRQLVGHEGPVNVATFSPDGRTIATASEDGSARVWGEAE